MTDKERFLKTLQSLGFTHKQTTKPAHAATWEERSDPERECDTIELDEGRGYPGFFVEFRFNLDGSFREHACYE